MALAGWVGPGTLSPNHPSGMCPYTSASPVYLCISDALRLPLLFAICCPLKLLTPPQFLCTSKAFGSVSNGLLPVPKGKSSMSSGWNNSYNLCKNRANIQWSLPGIFSQTPGVSWTRDVVFGFNGPLYISLPLSCQLLSLLALNILCQGLPRPYLLCEVLPPFGYFGS